VRVCFGRPQHVAADAGEAAFEAARKALEEELRRPLCDRD
jgi:hypothetical protein